jgi:hypothetical protein
MVIKKNVAKGINKRGVNKPSYFVRGLYLKIAYLFIRRMAKILISEALAEINKANAVFDIGFRKADGTFSKKDGVVNRRSVSTNRKKMNRNGLLSCYQPAKDYTFDVTIDLLMTLNGMKIYRPE